MKIITNHIFLNNVYVLSLILYFKTILKGLHRFIKVSDILKSKFIGSRCLDSVCIAKGIMLLLTTKMDINSSVGSKIVPAFNVVYKSCLKKLGIWKGQ